MNTSSIARAFTSTLLFLVVGGCAVETSASGVASDSISTTEPVHLRLYADAYAPFERCDVGTDFTMSPITDARLDRSGAVGVVSLRESAPSECDDVTPDPRSYELLYAGDDCGSAVYVASMTVDGNSRSFKLTDHRSRMCRDAVPAQVVVEEETETGAIRFLYARDPREVTCKLISGKRFAAGTSFRDRCNSCFCSLDGEMRCTLVACGEPTDSRAL